MATEKRLIDANALLEKVQFRMEIDNKNAEIIAGCVNIARRLIENAPTVDAVEVVHGRWIAVPSSDMMTGKAFKCSECNKMRYGSFMPNYCQNCGAKMDK